MLLALDVSVNLIQVQELIFRLNVAGVIVNYDTVRDKLAADFNFPPLPSSSSATCPSPTSL